MGVTFGSNYTQRFYSWNMFKTVANDKLLNIQYNEDDIEYQIWGYDGNEIHTCSIWKGTVPDGVVLNGYSQEQATQDLNDFESNYKINCNTALSHSTYANTYSIEASTSAVLLLSKNNRRIGATVFNKSNKILYIRFSDEPSESLWTVLVAPDSFVEIPFKFKGDIYGIWSGVNGSAKITELI